MKIATVVIGILVVMLISDNVQGKLVTKPSDRKAEIGHYVIMNCSSGYVNDTCGKITWRYFKINSSSEDSKSISTDGKLIPEVTSYISIIDYRAGNCNLKIKATPSAAGNYLCLDATPDFAYAQMTVLGNVPPVPNKKAYSRKDLSRLSAFYGIPINQPANLREVLMVKGSLSAQRLLTSVQMTQSDMTEHLSRELWMRVYSRDQDISKNESLLEALRSIGIPEDKATGLVESINDSKVKEKLKEVTNEALSYGAFGAPMIIARDGNNEEHFLFGSDRMELLASILGEKYEGPLLQYAVTLAVKFLKLKAHKHETWTYGRTY